MRYTEFDGKRYWQDKNGYFRRQGKLMHREIWKSHFGYIQKGFHIHHVDKNKENNEITNLECMSASHHHRLHGSETKSKEWARNLCEMIRPLTKEWHASQQGHEWHKMHAKEMKLGQWDPVKYVCHQCKVEFESTKRSNTKFCCNACKSKNRRDSLVDHIEIECDICKKNFTKNKYAKTRFCSRSCARKMVKNQIDSQS